MLSVVDDILNIAPSGVKSVETNAFINAQLEMKKLELNSDKCHNIHVGKSAHHCVELKSHEEKIVNVNSAKYVGGCDCK